MNKQKSAKGLGTWALALGLASCIIWTSYIDGQSLIGIICGRLGVHNPAALSWSVLIVTVPGMILGLSHTKDWGAKVGALICWGAAASVLFPLILYA